MTSEHKMSRREWFRLRPVRSKSEKKSGSSTPSVGDELPALQAVAHPVNHDGMDLSELPPMREALLAEVQVRELFSDIAVLGSNILLMQKSARSPRATVAKATTEEQLRIAQASLLSGAISRLQIRYHWQEQNWIDTLEGRKNGFRLIRIAHKPFEEA